MTTERKTENGEERISRKERERVIDHLLLSRGSSISSKLPATEMVVVVMFLWFW